MLILYNYEYEEQRPQGNITKYSQCLLLLYRTMDDFFPQMKEISKYEDVTYS